jgi:2,3-bisphosphoglycerate-independent phosphoglycerate mutase
MSDDPAGERPRRVLLFFIDGVGVGPDDPDVNLLATGDYPSLKLTEGSVPRAGAGPPAVAHGLDPSMGVPGLPQSATGQTTILTGVNAPAVMGAHISGFPGPTLRRLLFEQSILKRIRERGRAATFLNAYRPSFFHTPEPKRRLSATSLATMASGAPFRGWEDLLLGRAVTHDLTHWRIRERGYDVPPRSPETAGRIIAREAMRSDFSLFEYFETDRAGHDRDRERLARCLGDLDRALETVLREVDLATTTVIVVSDHGNVEDRRVKTHTLNPALFAAWGPGARGDGAKMRALTDVAPLVLRALGESESGPPA